MLASNLKKTCRTYILVPAQVLEPSGALGVVLTSHCPVWVVKECPPSSSQPVLWIRITLMRILMRIRRSGFWFLFDADPDWTLHPDVDLDPDPDPDPNKGSNPWKSAKIGTYSIHFGLSSASWCGSRTGSGSSLSLWCGSGNFFLFDADADPDYQNDAYPQHCP